MALAPDRPADCLPSSALLRRGLLLVVDELLANEPRRADLGVASLPSFLNRFRAIWNARFFDWPTPSDDAIRLALRGPLGLIREGVVCIKERRQLAAWIPPDREPGARHWVVAHRGSRQ